MSRPRSPAPRPPENVTREELVELAGLLRETSDLAERLGLHELAARLWAERGVIEHRAANITQRELFRPAEIRP